jgi:N-acetylglutamate synthase/N-acetylornithine aminotransferase
VLIASTGVIGQRIKMEQLKAGISPLVRNALSPKVPMPPPRPSSPPTW